MAADLIAVRWVVEEQRWPLTDILNRIRGEDVSWQIRTAFRPEGVTITTVYDQAVAERIVALHNAALTEQAG